MAMTASYPKWAYSGRHKECKTWDKRFACNMIRATGAPMDVVADAITCITECAPHPSDDITTDEMSLAFIFHAEDEDKCEAAWVAARSGLAYKYPVV